MTVITPEKTVPWGIMKPLVPQAVRERAGAHRSMTLAGIHIGGLVAVLMAMLMILGVFAAPAFAGDDDAKDYSMYKLSSSVSAYYSNALSPEGKTMEGWGAVRNSTANAGAFLGYPDSDLTKFLKWAASPLSGSSSTISYDMFKNARVNDQETFSIDGAEAYAQYGAALSDLGLDNTVDSMGGGFWNKIGGLVIFGAYQLAAGVDLLFHLVIVILDAINPFKILFAGVKKALPDDIANGMTNGVGVGPGPLYGISQWIAGWYSFMVSVSWVFIVPLFAAVLIFSLLMFRRMNKGSAVKNFVVRMMALIFMLPLLGGIYTSALTSMKDSTSVGSSGSSQAVLSTFVDFQGWASTSRLKVPDGATIEWDSSTGSASGPSLAAMRDTAAAINSSVGRYGAVHSATPSLDDFDPGSAKGTPSDQANASHYTDVKALLNRYTNGETFSASDFESQINGEVSNYTQKPDTKKENKELVGKFFTDFTDPEKMDRKKDEKDMIRPEDNPMISVKANTGLGADKSKEGLTVFKSNASPNKCSVMDTSGDKPAPAACSMSPLATYNYLNTDFDSNALVTYSSKKVMSGATRVSHSSVSLIGGNMFTTFLVWLNLLIVLLSFVIIGVGYALPMLANNVRRMLGLFTAIIPASLGSLGGIAKVLIYGAALILEMMATVYLYGFAQQMLISIPQIAETTSRTVLSGVGNGWIAGLARMMVASGIMQVITLFFSTGLLIAVVIALLRVRKDVLGAINEVVTKMINKLVGADAAPASPGGGGMGSGLASGAAAGAGMAAANNLMGGRGNGGPRAAKNNGASGKNRGNGPGSIQTGPGAPTPGAPGGAGAAAGAGVAGLLGGGTNGTTGADGNIDGSAGPDGAGYMGDAGADGNYGGVDISNGSTTAEDERIANEVRANGGFDVANADQSGAAEGVDANGNPVSADQAGVSGGVDANGNRVDANGNPVLDENGNPVPAGELTAAEKSAGAVGVDEHGNAVNAEGNRVDANGNPVLDENGNPVSAGELAAGEAAGYTAQGQALDANGHPIDETGNRVGPDGAAVTDAEGNPVRGGALLPGENGGVDAQGRSVNGKGQLIGDDGAVVSDAKGNPVPGAAPVKTKLAAEAFGAQNGAAHDEARTHLASGASGMSTTAAAAKNLTDQKAAAAAVGAGALAGAAGATAAKTLGGASGRGEGRSTTAGRHGSSAQGVQAAPGTPVRRSQDRPRSGAVSTSGVNGTQRTGRTTGDTARRAGTAPGARTVAGTSRAAGTTAGTAANAASPKVAAARRASAAGAGAAGVAGAAGARTVAGAATTGSRTQARPAARTGKAAAATSSTRKQAAPVVVNRVPKSSATNGRVNPAAPARGRGAGAAKNTESKSSKAATSKTAAKTRQSASAKASKTPARRVAAAKPSAKGRRKP